MKNVKYLLTLGIVVLLCIMTTISAQASSEVSTQNKASASFKIMDTDDDEGGAGDSETGNNNESDDSLNSGSQMESEQSDNGDKQGKLPQTGESFKFSVIVLGLSLSGIGLILLIWRRRTEAADKME